jgi:hypothetical protein
MRYVLLAVVALALGGCQTTEQVITKTELQVVIPDRTLFNCPSIIYPKSDTLTDVEVAKLLVSFQRSNAECKRNMNAIKTFLENAKAQTESAN